MGSSMFLEETFEEFRKYCCEEGFDLSYFSSEIKGSLREIENYQFKTPKIIKLEKKRFGYKGIPFDVAEWQQEQWHNHLTDILDRFSTHNRYSELGMKPILK